MSTKIYNGYKVEITSDKNSLEDFNAFIKRTRKLMSDKRVEIENQLFTKQAVNMIDDYMAGIGEYNGDEIPYVKVGRELSLELREAERAMEIWMKFMDLSCSVCFFPMENALLATFFSQRDEYRKIWESLPEVTSYFYWNNTDIPENFTEEEWDERGLEWEKAMGETYIPSREGICVDMALSDELFQLDKSVLDNRERAIRVTKKKITDRILEDEYSEEERDTPKALLGAFKRASVIDEHMEDEIKKVKKSLIDIDNTTVRKRLKSL